MDNDSRHVCVWCVRVYTNVCVYRNAIQKFHRHKFGIDVNNVFISLSTVCLMVNTKRAIKRCIREIVCVFFYLFHYFKIVIHVMTLMSLII